MINVDVFFSLAIFLVVTVFAPAFIYNSVMASRERRDQDDENESWRKAA